MFKILPVQRTEGHTRAIEIIDIGRTNNESCTPAVHILIGFANMCARARVCVFTNEQVGYQQTRKEPPVQSAMQCDHVRDNDNGHTAAAVTISIA